MNDYEEGKLLKMRFLERINLIQQVNESNFYKDRTRFIEYFIKTATEIEKDIILDYISERRNICSSYNSLENNEPSSSISIAMTMLEKICKTGIDFKLKTEINKYFSKVFPSLKELPGWRYDEIINKMICIIKESFGIV